MTITAAPPAEPNYSFAALWPEEERETVHEIEQHIALGELSEALRRIDTTASRILASAAAAGGDENLRDPALVASLMGVSGNRYLRFRVGCRLGQAAGGKGAPASLPQVLDAFAFLVELRALRNAMGG